MHHPNVHHIAGSVGAFLLVAACATAPRFDGPLTVRNQHPAQLTVLQMDPAGAAVLPAGETRVRVDGAYTSYFLAGTAGGDRFEMDGELLRVGAKANIGLGKGLELTAELPVAHTTGGFLDSFLIHYHDFFGFPDQGRSAAPRDRWQVRAVNNGVTAYEMSESGLELLDIPMALTWSFVPLEDDRPWGLAARVGVEWPTGNEDRGFGNGEVDVALGLLGEWRTGPLALTGHAQHTFAGDPAPASAAGLDWQDVTSVGLGAEWWLGDGFALLVQTAWESSVLGDLQTPRASDPHWLLWIGGRVPLSGQTNLEVGFGEDLNSFISPDFTAYLAIAFHLGGSGESP